MNLCIFPREEHTHLRRVHHQEVACAHCRCHVDGSVPDPFIVGATRSAEHVFTRPRRLHPLHRTEVVRVEDDHVGLGFVRFQRGNRTRDTVQAGVDL